MATPSPARFLDRTTPPHIATLTVLAGVSAMVMNMFLPSLAKMAQHFEVSYSLMQLSVSAYLGASALLQILIGPLSDKWGRRPVILVGLVAFIVASIGCIYAPNVEIFLACRMAQASIAVCMVLSRAVIRDLYEGDNAASMIGWVTMGMAVVPLISPMFGGVLDAAFGWKSVFWAFAGIGGAVFALTWFDQGETAKPSGLTLRAQFQQYPELLKSPRFWGYCSAAAFTSGAFFSYLGGAAFVGAYEFNMSTSALGLAIGTPAVGYAIGNGLTGAFATRVGIRRMVLLGTSLCSLALAISLSLFYAGLGNLWVFFGMMTIVGIGNGLALPNATAGLLSVRPHLAGTASGLGSAIMIGGGAVLAAFAGAQLSEETGAFPLLWIQLGTSLFGVIAILMVFWRDWRLSRRHVPGD